MNVAHWSNLVEERDSLVEQCLGSRDIRVETYALSITAYIKVARFTPEHDAYHTLAHNYYPMLETYLEQLLEQGRDPLTREVEAMLRGALALCYFHCDAFPASIKHASQAIFWADHVGASFCTTRAKSLLISVQSETGSVVSALSLTEKELDNDASNFVTRRFHERAHAILLYYLGHNVKPLKILKDASLRYDSPTHQPIRAEIMRQSCLLGIGGLDGDIVQAFPHLDEERWVTSSLRCLLRAVGLPRTNQNLKERELHLGEAINIWDEDKQYKQLWHKVLGRWVVGLAQLRLGKPLLALNALESIAIEDTQWLDLRLLVAGLRLEIALNLHRPELSTEPYEKDLLTVFRDARALALASEEGLCERLMFWHPLAAAYAALLPDAPVALQPASRAVLRVGVSNTVYELTLPPTYAAELALRSIDFDLRSQLRFVQADPGSSRYRRGDLLTRRGEISYWRPSLSAVSLIYGLVKAGRRDQANVLYHEYGVTPTSTAEYVMLPQLEHIGRSVSKLLSGSQSLEEFTTAVLNFD